MRSVTTMVGYHGNDDSKFADIDREEHFTMLMMVEDAFEDKDRLSSYTGWTVFVQDRGQNRRLPGKVLGYVDHVFDNIAESLECEPETYERFKAAYPDPRTDVDRWDFLLVVEVLDPMVGKGFIGEPSTDRYKMIVHPRDISKSAATLNFGAVKVLKKRPKTNG